MEISTITTENNRIKKVFKKIEQIKSQAKATHYDE